VVWPVAQHRSPPDPNGANQALVQKFSLAAWADEEFVAKNIIVTAIAAPSSNIPRFANVTGCRIVASFTHASFC
jgi:hypothetical protein